MPSAGPGAGKGPAPKAGLSGGQVPRAKAPFSPRLLHPPRAGCRVFGVSFPAHSVQLWAIGWLEMVPLRFHSHYPLLFWGGCFWPVACAHIPGQGSNLSHSSDNPMSLTATTRELQEAPAPPPRLPLIFRALSLSVLEMTGTQLPAFSAGEVPWAHIRMSRLSGSHRDAHNSASFSGPSIPALSSRRQTGPAVPRHQLHLSDWEEGVDGLETRVATLKPAVLPITAAGEMPGSEWSGLVGGRGPQWRLVEGRGGQKAPVYHPRTAALGC